MTPPSSALELALLGLLARGPASGYDLRRVFQTTALGRYSDSPGSIYPALRRLQARGLVVGRDQGDARRRRLLRLTALGRRALVQWIGQPVRTEDLERDLSLVDLRLAFVSDAMPERLPTFVREYAQAATRRAAALEAARRGLEKGLSESATLALDLGIALVRARAAWCRDASRSIKDS